MALADRPSTVLADWLSAADWARARELLSRHRERLTDDDTVRQLGQIAARSRDDRRLAVFEAVLRLARAGHADVAFKYLGRRQPADRVRFLLGTVRKQDVPPALLAGLIRPARWVAAGEDDEADIVLQIAVETVLTLGRLELDDAERKAILCLQPAHRGQWLDERRTIVGLIGEELGAAGADLVNAIGTWRGSWCGAIRQRLMPDQGRTTGTAPRDTKPVPAGGLPCPGA
ncbi:hypothetical protein [Dactylosporangium sp. CA-152071]|uniref:hypothetical protein n=1 Tax=Dactylosporangium sp. CA-152071 TaxID=3239933 RepID=UPI003D8BEA8C